MQGYTLKCSTIYPNNDSVNAWVLVVIQYIIFYAHIEIFSHFRF